MPRVNFAALEKAVLDNGSPLFVEYSDATFSPM
jgi:hypothetical protein